MDDYHVDFDDVLPLAGEFGRYQWLLFFALAPFCFNLVFVYFMQFFMTLEPNHWCLVPELLEANLTSEERKNLSIPIGSAGFSKCQVYDVDYKTLLQEGFTSADPSWPVKDCSQWEYDFSTTGNFPTIVSELNWVCDRSWYGTLAQSVFFLGAIVGGIICGWAADKYGRVPVLVATNLIGAICSLLTATAWSLGEFLVYRFLIGLAFDNIFVMMYVLAIEYVGPKHRTLVANLSIALFYTAGTVLLPWYMVLIGDWRIASVASGFPMILTCTLYWILPESARWLLTQGRVDETVEILKKIAEVNGKKIPEKVLMDMKRSAIEENSASPDEPSQEDWNASFLDLLKTPRLRRNTLIICFMWMLLTLVYDGHVRNVMNLPLDVFVSFTVASATELPADLLVVFFLDRWGRRWFLFVALVLSGVLSILTCAFPATSIGIPVLAILGRFCVNIAFNIGLQYASEVLPTVVRAQGVAVVHIMGYVAGLLSPLVVFIGTINTIIPLVILGVASIISGSISLGLPETLHRDLPQTIDDGEKFGRDQSFCDFPCIADRKPSPPLSLGEIGQQPSFIRPRLRQRASVRGETYRSTLIKHRMEVVYLPAAI
ncbi:organic cation transporter protein-like [Macrobrachium rosenbergii]|uniref:organic cation transporter protein-like n=1 Tax=Macrobrachium rosenbergii TaxID=79674 RepID=UPI0034D3CFA7